MKKEFLKICDNLNLEIVQYNSYRSDMGSQVYVIHTSYMGSENSFVFSDSYIIGEEKSKKRVVEQFLLEANEFIKNK